MKRQWKLGWYPVPGELVLFGIIAIYGSRSIKARKPSGSFVERTRCRRFDEDPFGRAPMRRMAVLFALVLAGVHVTGEAKADYADDIAESILRDVRADKTIGPYELNVTVGRGEFGLRGGEPGMRKGEVHLEGRVSTEADRERIESIARGVPRITLLENRIAVSDSLRAQPRIESFETKSPEVAKRALKRLREEGVLTHFRISLKEKPDGVLVMTGEVPERADIERVERVVAGTEGVTKVENQLTLMKERSDEEITSAVYQNLQSAKDIRGLSVSTKEGAVTLKGDAPGHTAIDKAMSITLMVPGVKKVDSEITIQGRPYQGTHSSNH